MTHSSRFLVTIRIRPSQEKEIEHPSHYQLVSPLSDQLLIFDPKRTNEWTPTQRRQIKAYSTVRRRKDIKYAFDQVFSDDASQQKVYDGTGKIAVDRLWDGFNASVFAYGATGAGKTVTMIGNEDLGPGVMVLAMRDLFERISIDTNFVCELKMSYLEIYNEKLRDLLCEETDTQALKICESSDGIAVSGLSFHFPTSADEVFELLALGNGRRTTDFTDANALSSRSHAVLQITLQKKLRTHGVDAAIVQSTLSLIDLAGSERASVTNNRGSTLREGASINRSLLSLGNCINALCGAKKSTYIPYRDSKLTRLLKDSLGGNSQTVMIANVCASSLSYEETHNTLKYANRAKNIKIRLRNVKVRNVTYHVSEYKKIIARLQSELEEAQEKSGIGAGLKLKLEKVQRKVLEGAQYVAAVADWERAVDAQCSAVCAGDLAETLKECVARRKIAESVLSQLEWNLLQTLLKHATNAAAKENIALMYEKENAERRGKRSDFVIRSLEEALLKGRTSAAAVQVSSPGNSVLRSPVGTPVKSSVRIETPVKSPFRAELRPSPGPKFASPVKELKFEKSRGYKSILKREKAIRTEKSVSFAAKPQYLSLSPLKKNTVRAQRVRKTFRGTPRLWGKGAAKRSEKGTPKTWKKGTPSRKEKSKKQNENVRRNWVF